jgi:hypothetical protein
MEKGLSVLQKTILVLAHRKQSIRNREVLTQVYGFKPSRCPTTHGGTLFNRQSIGLKRYFSGTSAVSRAMGRLMKRGLIRRAAWCTFALTDAGKKVAQEING